MAELTVRDVIEWLRDERGAERIVAARRRAAGGRWRTGHLTTSGFAYDAGYLRVSYSGSTRRRYTPVYDRDIAAGNLQLRGENGRYVDAREVIPHG